MDTENVIGIVGGMGPQAGLSLVNSIVRQTEAATDQEHLSTILMSFPRHIVDRTAFLEGRTGVNPALGIVAVIRKLEKAGAKVVGIACNTSHSPEIFGVIIKELDKMNSGVKLLNMPWETCAWMRKKYPEARRIGLMTTNGTYRSGVYKELLQSYGYDVVVPEYKIQHEVIHKMIYDPTFGLKAVACGITDEVRMLARTALRYFKDKECQVIILGCTDLSLLLDENVIDGSHIVDSTRALAQALIREATASHASAASSL